jgi:hypothetical protein
MSAGNLNPLLVHPRLPPTQVQIEHCVFDVAQQKRLSTHVCMCTLSLLVMEGCFFGPAGILLIENTLVFGWKSCRIEKCTRRAKSEKGSLSFLRRAMSPLLET